MEIKLFTQNTINVLKLYEYFRFVGIFRLCLSLLIIGTNSLLNHSASKCCNLDFRTLTHVPLLLKLAFLGQHPPSSPEKKKR